MYRLGKDSTTICLKYPNHCRLPGCHQGAALLIQNRDSLPLPSCAPLEKLLNLVVLQFHLKNAHNMKLYLFHMIVSKSSCED